MSRPDAWEKISRARLRELLAEWTELLDEPPPESIDLDTPGTYSGASLELAETALRRAASHEQSSAQEGILELVTRLQEFSAHVLGDEERQRQARLHECVNAIEALRSITGIETLVSAACKELTDRCGFRRAVVSRVVDGSWRPWKAHFRAVSDSWFEPWVDQHIQLDARFPEHRLLYERRAIAVYDTRREPVHEAIIVDSGSSRSYVVAPIIIGGGLVGLIHTDHFPTPRRVDLIDRDVLWSFAQTFGHMIEKLMILGRVRTQSSHAREVLTEAAQEFAGSTTLDGTAREEGVREGTAPSMFGTFTGREREVLRLMGEGLNNAAIAQRLIISQDTVKSHVKRILRKLGATNRTHAIVWLHQGGLEALES